MGAKPPSGRICEANSKSLQRALKSERRNQMIISDKNYDKEGNEDQLVLEMVAVEKVALAVMHDIHQLVTKAHREECADP